MRKSIVFPVDWLLSSPISIWDILVMSLSSQHQSFSNSLRLKEKVRSVRLAIFPPPTFIFSLLSVTKSYKISQLWSNIFILVASLQSYLKATFSWRLPAPRACREMLQEKDAHWSLSRYVLTQ